MQKNDLAKHAKPAKVRKQDSQRFISDSGHRGYRHLVSFFIHSSSSSFASLALFARVSSGVHRAWPFTLRHESKETSCAGLNARKKDD
jgi:hypothetical protein